jgi:hypothetical protein
MLWLNETDVALMPQQPLMSNSKYEVRVLMDSLRDLRGNTYVDSTSALQFETLDLRTTGVIEGTVVDEQQHIGEGAVYIFASSVGVEPERRKTIRLESPGAFRMEHLIEGKYVIEGFRDADNSGRYSYGRPFPFIPAERFAMYPDTVKIRARWGIEGVLLKFKQR